MSETKIAENVPESNTVPADQTNAATNVNDSESKDVATDLKSTPSAPPADDASGSATKEGEEADKASPLKPVKNNNANGKKNGKKARDQLKKARKRLSFKAGHNMKSSDSEQDSSSSANAKAATTATTTDTAPSAEAVSEVDESTASQSDSNNVTSVTSEVSKVSAKLQNTDVGKEKEKVTPKDQEEEQPQPSNEQAKSPSEPQQQQEEAAEKALPAMKPQKLLYDFTFKDSRGEDFPVESLKGKAVLIVNIASKCGFTPQLAGLEELHKKYNDKGLVVLGFPCNQFGKQNPLNDEQTVEFCQKNYGVSFPVMAKIDVNKDNAHPLYHWLKTEIRGFLGLSRIKWNFEKFLVDTDGKVCKRYSSLSTPSGIEGDIAAVLKCEVVKDDKPKPQKSKPEAKEPKDQKQKKSSKDQEAPKESKDQEVPKESQDQEAPKESKNQEVPKE